jgi:hypothetical protein
MLFGLRGHYVVFGLLLCRVRFADVMSLICCGLYAQQLVGFGRGIPYCSSFFFPSVF